jgi:DNA-binding transcriptional MerR regulator
MSSNLQIKSSTNQTDSRLLDEVQAANLAGVTVDTIHRYRDFGLLRVVDKDGGEFFEEVDIRNLFYTRKQSQGQRNDSESTFTAEGQSTETTAELKVADTQTSAELNQESISSEKLTPAPESPAEIEQDIKIDTADNNKNSIIDNFFSQSENKAAPHITVDGRQLPPSSTAKNSAYQSDEAFPSTFPDSEREALNQLNLALKEQLEIVRQERDWLRQRIERLETRSEREQMLLLTESQTLKSVLADSGFGKTESFWKRALPWIKG